MVGEGRGSEGTPVESRGVSGIRRGRNTKTSTTRGKRTLRGRG